MHKPMRATIFSCQKRSQEQIFKGTAETPNDPPKRPNDHQAIRVAKRYRNIQEHSFDETSLHSYFLFQHIYYLESTQPAQSKEIKSISSRTAHPHSPLDVQSNTSAGGSSNSNSRLRASLAEPYKNLELSMYQSGQAGFNKEVHLDLHSQYNAHYGNHRQLDRNAPMTKPIDICKHQRETRKKQLFQRSCARILCISKAKNNTKPRILCISKPSYFLCLQALSSEPSQPGWWKIIYIYICMCACMFQFSKKLEHLIFVDGGSTLFWEGGSRIHHSNLSQASFNGTEKSIQTLELHSL